MKTQTRISKSLETLRRLEHLDGLEPALEQICARYRLSHMTFLVVRNGISSKTYPYYCSTYPKSWVRTYSDRAYFEIDPVIQVLRKGLLPVDWSTLDRNSAPVVRFFDDARSHGVGPNGLTLPVRGANGERSLLSVASNLSRPQWSTLCVSSTHDLHILSHYLHEKAFALSGLREEIRFRDLSRRETQCLQLLASGKIYKQIAAALGISESSVRLYLRSARRKLRASTSHQAVAKASFLELINF